jgi:putative oxidoreductase
MLFPQLTALVDVALFLLRLMMAALFGTSGWSHVTKPKERAASIGMTPTFTFLLGLGELAAAASLLLGIYPQLGALLLIAIMLGAIQKKMFVWKTGFWGEKGQGWYYELLYIVCNLVIVATGGGAIALT